MSEPSLTRFVTEVLAEQDAIDWFENMPESMNVCLRDHDGNMQVLDISSAMSLYSGDHAPWFIDIDTSGAMIELEQELGFDIETLHDQAEQCFHLYIEALSEANNACMHLYTYSRRLDAAHVWATTIPESLRTSDGETIQKEIRTYLRGLGEGMLLRETLQKYGKATIKAKKLKNMLNTLNKMTELITKDQSNPNVIMSVASVTVGTETLAGLVGHVVPVMPQCKHCKQRPGSHVMSPCGHLACVMCMPLDDSDCPQCGVAITSRQRINLPID